MVELTEEQRAVFDMAIAFLNDPDPARQWFLFEGPAGTGKTVVLAELARTVPRSRLCAFTGKAASVLSRKTGMLAKTIHSTIYEFMGEDDKGNLVFDQKIEAGEWEGAVALVDESGTVWGELARDLLATGCRVIACGDPGQLPPVNGERFFTGPDAVLRTVHRQALDSAVLRQAHAVLRTGLYAPDGDDFRVERHVGRDDIMNADVILCWRNATRVMLNRLKRAHLGIEGPLRKGEPVMCLRNEHSIGIMNGACYTLLEDRRPWDAACIVNERGEEVEVPCRVEDLEAPATDRKTVPFAMAYACTVHKAQGSEWDRLIVVDEYDRRDARVPWIYTAITRAAKSVLVQRDW